MIDLADGAVPGRAEYAPICACGIKAVEREVKKEGPNKGKRFWGCSRWKVRCIHVYMYMCRI